MQTHTYITYSFDELSEDAQQNALNNWQNDQTEIFWMDETIESLKAIIKASGLYLRDWSLGAYNRDNFISIDFPSSIRELSGQRAIAWIENNLLSDLRITQNTKDYLKYNRSYVDKSLRPYSIGKIRPCPFTGYFADDIYLESLVESCNNGNTLEDAFNGLAYDCQKLLEDELNYQCSEEYFKEYCADNDCQFDENGNMR